MSNTQQIVAIAGGVGGAKLARGLFSSVAPRDLMIIVNVGDDFEHLGLSISPDLDSMLYGVSGRDDTMRGWGRANETWSFMASLRELNPEEAWFNLGDRDLAVHVERTRRIRRGELLSSITGDFARAFGIEAEIVPVTNDRLRTLVLSDQGELPFQQYFVAQQCRPVVRGIRFDGDAQATLTPAISKVLAMEVEAIVFCPSNPFISIDPIMAVPGIRDLILASKSAVVAVSPIVGGSAIKGPAAKMMTELGLECSPLGIARHYAGLIDGIVIDHVDAHLAPEIRGLGIDVAVTATVMKVDDDKTQLARATLDFARQISAQTRGE